MLLQNITKSRTKSVTVLSKNELILNQSTTKYTQQQIENPEGEILTRFMMMESWKKVSIVFVY